MRSEPAPPIGAAPLSLRIRPPATLGQVLHRERLLALLQETLARNVVLVEAPPGYGKSYFLADAFRHLSPEFSVAWLTLAPAYGSETEIAGEMLAAIAQRDAAAAEDAETRLARAIDERLGRTVLLIDGADGGNSPRLSPLLGRLAARFPERLRLVVASRLPLEDSSLQQLLLQGAVGRIGAADLAFTQEEAAAAVPRALAGHVADRIASFAAGWPAVIRLGAVAVDADRRGEALADFFAGTFAPLRHYIRQQVLPCFDAGTQAVLRMSGYLDAVSDELIEALGPAIAPGERADLFDRAEPLLVRLGDRPGWYGFAPALAAVSKSEFTRLPRGERSAIHAAAASWFASKGFLEDAVHHSVETGEFAVAEQAIREAGGVRIFLRSGFPTLRLLLSELPRHVILGSTGLQLCQAVVMGKHGQIENARDLVEDVRQALGAGDRRVDILPEDLSQIDWLIAIYEDRIGRPEIVRQLEQDVRLLDPREAVRIALAGNYLTIVFTIAGAFERAEAEALKSLTLFREADMRYAQIFMLIHLALIAASRGRPLAGMEFAREAQSLVDRGQRRDPHLQAILNVPLAELHYARGDVDRAGALLGDAIPALEKGEAWVDLFARAYLTLMRVSVARNDTGHALRIADMAEQVASERSLPRLKLIARLIRLEATTRAGLTEAAEEIAASIGWLVGIDGGPHAFRPAGLEPTWREKHLALLLLARVEWARRRPVAALGFLARLAESARAIDAGIELVTALALRFCYQWHMKRPDAARQDFQLAVALATPQQLVRAFADEGYPMTVAVRGLLRQFGAAAFSHATIEFTNAVLAAHIDQGSANQDAAPGARVEILLSDYEQEILEHLSRGLSNKEIARQIGRSEPTVKYHLRRIYAKLGVKSRGMAVVMARQASLVA